MTDNDLSVNNGVLKESERVKYGVGYGVVPKTTIKQATEWVTCGKIIMI